MVVNPPIYRLLFYLIIGVFNYVLFDIYEYFDNLIINRNIEFERVEIKYNLFNY